MNDICVTITKEMNNTECKQSTILEIMAENSRLKRENAELKYYKSLYNNSLHNEMESNKEEIDKPLYTDEEEYALSNGYDNYTRR